MRKLVPGLLGMILVLNGCGDNQLGLDKVRPNQPPETTLSSGPPDSTAGTAYRVQLFWSGTDRDGTVSHYDFILVDHPPIRDHIDGNDEDPSRVIVEVPAPDDPRWVGTSSTDSIFISLADTLRRDPWPGDDETPGDVRNVPFERWHTFFVRAVDNEGLADPTPDYRSFNSKNIAPIVRLQPPIMPGSEFVGPPVIVFNWDGEDPVDESTTIDPVASRYVMISTKKDLSAAGYVNFPDSLYVLPERYHWSPWKRWDAQDGSGRRAIISGLNEVGQDGCKGCGFYIFAVQALDEAGAVTPVFDWQSAGKNNVALVRVSGTIGPVLTVRENFLGVQSFVGGSRPIQLDIAGGQPINFRWGGNASHYGGEIVAYRYGWDIRNPESDEEWSSWALTNTKAPTKIFSSRSHRFFLQVRDNAETITQAIYELTVHTVTQNRDLLWVDDTDWLTDIGSENGEETRWIQVLSDVAADNGFTFEPNVDVYDVALNRNLPPPIQKVFDYKAVVWSNRSRGNGESALRDLAQFVDPYQSLNTARAFNFLNIYLANGGALWINGFRPAKQLWTDKREPGHAADPVNVTNWDDPDGSHPPGVDSVGTSSLLYAMGIEMFDVGAGTGAAREKKQHFCYGLRRGAVANTDSQRTISSVALNHTHELAIATQDVEAFAPMGKTYRTSWEFGHSHAVSLSAEDFLALRQGDAVQVESSVSETPEPHSHAFEIVDLQGAWGAPALIVSSAWGQGGTAGRTGIEIYNMPNARLNETPPLYPLPGISLDLYAYVSGVPEDPDTNLFYPDTADNQPVLVLAKGVPSEPYFRRAFCGFEPYLLEARSHENLAEFILVRHFRLGR